MTAFLQQFGTFLAAVACVIPAAVAAGRRWPANEALITKIGVIVICLAFLATVPQ